MKLAVSGQIESLREALGHAMVEAGEADERVVTVNADLMNSVKSQYFRATFPDRAIEVGIAEQNMMGIAAGLAQMGFVPYTLTFARFASKRAADQISMCIDYARTNVKIVGAYAGIFTGRQGVSQQTIEDTATLRAMPNMTVIDAADAIETRAIVLYAAQHDGPVYLRVGRDEWPVTFDRDSYRFEFGKGQVLRDGGDVAIVNSGLLLHHALAAADLLAAEGIDAAVVNMPTIKPIDARLVERLARDIGALVTVENHSILGGFGSAVAEVVVESIPVPMERIGIRDEYSESAPNSDLAEKHGLTAPYIASAAKRVIERKHGSGHLVSTATGDRR
jgi:transketolase